MAATLSTVVKQPVWSARLAHHLYCTPELVVEKEALIIDTDSLQIGWLHAVSPESCNGNTVSRYRKDDLLA